MNLTISHKGQNVPATLTRGDAAALYAVPAAYSEDGLYLARWGAGELEPLPACGTSAPLLRLRLGGMEGEESLAEEYKAEGVSYAQN